MLQVDSWFSLEGTLQPAVRKSQILVSLGKEDIGLFFNKKKPIPPSFLIQTVKRSCNSNVLWDVLFQEVSLDSPRSLSRSFLLGKKLTTFG